MKEERDHNRGKGEKKSLLPRTLRSRGLQFAGYQRMVVAFLLLVNLLIFGTLGYELIERPLEPFQAFFMTVITVSTVGFSEIEGISQASRPLTVLLIFAGFGMFSYVIFTISQVVVEGEIRKYFWRRKMDRAIASLNNHVIVCGYGKIGESVAAYLNKYNQPFVVVEREPERRDELAKLEYLFVIGDATDDDVLEEAGINRASKLVAATDSDSQNVFIVLTARELKPDLVIHSRAYAEEAEKRLVRAGANKVVFPDHIGGYRLAMGIMRPTFTNFVDVVTRSYEEGEIGVNELTVSNGSPLTGKTLFDAKIRQDFNLIILAIRNADGAFHFNPGKDTVIEENDTLIAIGLRRDLNAFEKHISS